jgi:Xaa-Pro aminopeptidase
MHDGATAHDVHRAVSKGFTDRGYHLGHVTGHSIGMTMIEHPRVGEGLETVLRAGMVLSMHPHAIAQDGNACLYMQDTWLVTDHAAELASLELMTAARALGGDHAGADEEGLEQDDPEDGVAHDQLRVHAHTSHIGRGEVN